jgi:sterol desaturase/sphingolipid hydroxylase (fatty acid hydroxylase superfamily)
MNALLSSASTALVDVARLSVWLALLAILFAPIERLFALRRRDGARAILTDLGYFYLNGILPAMLLAPPLALVAALVRQVTPDAYVAAVAALPFVAKLVIGLIVAEIGTYWAHRWCHASPLLWRFHAIHHSVEHLDWLANTRAHPVDVVFTRLCGLAPLYALGLAQPTASGSAAMIPVYVTLAGTVWAFFIHANVRWRFGWGERVVSTPAFHHWHHTNDVHRDRNFAALLPGIDWLFGTLHLPRSWPPCYGVDEPVEGSMARQLLHPVTASAAESDRPSAVRVD